MSNGLANEWWSQVCDREEDDEERLDAAGNLAESLAHQRKYDEAEKMEREVLAVRKRVLGADHPDTLTTAGNLAHSLKSQGKYDEEVAMEREVLCSETSGARSRASRHVDSRGQSCCIPQESFSKFLFLRTIKGSSSSAVYQ